MIRVSVVDRNVSLFQVKEHYFQRVSILHFNTGKFSFFSLPLTNDISIKNMHRYVQAKTVELFCEEHNIYVYFVCLAVFRYRLGTIY